jgi:hypothetical protein
MRLDALQRSMMAAVEHGPDHVPAGVFAGARAAALRGLAVHANAISHARLVALEDSFPRTRKLLGQEEFNRLSRAFVATAAAKAEPVATIGRRFPDFLPAHGGCLEAGALARFEWAWLESYHAAEANAFGLADLAGLPEDRLLAVRLARHPASRILDTAAAGVFESEAPAIAEADMILLSRPEAEVRVVPATRAMSVVFRLLGVPREVGGLFQAAGEAGVQACDTTPALIALIETGALMRCVPESG